MTNDFSLALDSMVKYGSIIKTYPGINLGGKKVALLVVMSVPADLDMMATGYFFLNIKLTFYYYDYQRSMYGSRYIYYNIYEC